MARWRHFERNGACHAWAQLEAGFDDYFAKPISLKYFCQAVKESFIKIENWQACA